LKSASSKVLRSFDEESARHMAYGLNSIPL